MRKFLFTCLILLLPWSAMGQGRLQEMGRYSEAFGEEKPFAQGFYEKALQHQADPQWVMEILGRAKLMRDQGLPTQPFFLKASEGLQKKVPPSRILPALENTQKQTETAGSLVDQAVARGALVSSPQVKREAILNYQRALLNDVPPSRLQKLSEKIDPRSSKTRIEELGVAAREIPRLKREGLSEEEAFERAERKLKEKGLEEKPMKETEKAPSEKELGKKKEEKEFPKEKPKREIKEKREKEFKIFEKESSDREKRESPSLSSPGKGHGKGK